MTRVRFGPFEADLTSGELRRDGVTIPLQPQPFAVLAALLERPGQLVPREVLRRQVWGEDVFLDFDHGLNKAVSKLREVLGDDGAEPRFIQTLPRRGYRFVANVRSSSRPSHPMAVARLLYEGRTIPLAEGVHVVGRDETNDICLESPTVSRRHAHVTVTADAVAVDDLQSKNGTRVNGRRVRRVTVLNDGDEIEFGAVLMTVRIRRVQSTLTSSRAQK